MALLITLMIFINEKSACQISSVNGLYPSLYKNNTPPYGGVLRL